MIIEADSPEIPLFRGDVKAIRRKRTERGKVGAKSTDLSPNFSYPDQQFAEKKPPSAAQLKEDALAATFGRPARKMDL